MKRFEIHTRKGRVLTIEAESCASQVLGASMSGFGSDGEIGHQLVVLRSEGQVIASFYDADWCEVGSGAEASA